jgi:4'-phosphopantetheinyl transferase EntD
MRHVVARPTRGEAAQYARGSRQTPRELSAVGYFATLLDPRIAVAEAALGSEPPVLPVDEALSITNAVPRRRLEFATGRDCARRAMAALGHAKASIPRGQDRVPIWPDDLVGNITHTDDWVAAAVARRDQGFAAIGIDLEPAAALPPDLWASVCAPEEQAKLTVIRGMTPGLAARLAFCMKEAAFKCQYALSCAMLEFADLAIDVDAEAGTFAAAYRKVVPPFDIHDRLFGRFAISADHIASAVVVTSEQVLRCMGRLGAILAALIILNGDGGVAMSEEAREATATSAWAPRDHVRAFYSGHSLSEGVPEVVERIARSLGHRLDFEAQILGYSLLRQRTKGEVSSASEWAGYRAGQNRGSAGLDVAEELRQPRRLSPGDKYDVLVVTERHDLPAIARKERTAFYLTEMAKHLLTGKPDAEVLLYHTWLHVDPDAPWPWIDYERAVLPMWECIASRANLKLPARGDIARVRVLPGGAALAELAATLWDGKVPGVAGKAPGERVRLLFSDNVHMSDIGRYFIALVHYAVLFGHSPEGAAIPAAIAPETGRYMQTLAWQYAVSYGQRANAAVRRDMATCRDLMQNEICPAFAALQSKGVPGLAKLRRLFDTYRCRREYADADDAENPFASPRE